jgi:hypothetical protein
MVWYPYPSCSRVVSCPTLRRRGPGGATWQHDPAITVRIDLGCPVLAGRLGPRRRRKPGAAAVRGCCAPRTRRQPAGRAQDRRRRGAGRTAGALLFYGLDSRVWRDARRSTDYPAHHRLVPRCIVLSVLTCSTVFVNRPRVMIAQGTWVNREILTWLLKARQQPAVLCPTVDGFFLLLVPGSKTALHSTPSNVVFFFMIRQEITHLTSDMGACPPELLGSRVATAWSNGPQRHPGSLRLHPNPSRARGLRVSAVSGNRS